MEPSNTIWEEQSQKLDTEILRLENVSASFKEFQDTLNIHWASSAMGYINVDIENIITAIEKLRKELEQVDIDAKIIMGQITGNNSK